MTTQLTLFGGDAQLPDHLKDWGIEDNVVVRDQIPQLSFRGKVWRLMLKGKEEVQNGPDGEPAGAVQVIILDYNKARSRAYYEGDFEEGKNRAPSCWSNDGKTPDASIEEPQALTCDSCPQSVKGSKIVNGKESVACSQYKRAVVVPAVNPSFEPLLLKIPQTSIWDKDNAENEAKQWYAFDQYMDMLKRHGIMHTGKVITRMKFDSRMAYPKILFHPDGMLPPELKPAVLAQCAKKEVLAALLNAMPDIGGKPADAAPAPAEYAEPAAVAQTAPASAPPQQMPQPVAPAPAAPAAAPARTPRPRPAPKAATPPPAAPAAAPDEEGLAVGGFGAPAAPAAAPAPVTTTTPVSAATPTAKNGLASLLAGWDDQKKE